MKKIAFFCYDQQMGGIQKSLINLLDNLDYSKYEVDLYLFNKEDSFFVNTINKKVNIIYLNIGIYHKVFNCIPFRLVRLLKFNVKKIQYDYAIDFDSYQALTAAACLKTNAKKHIMWIHNDVYLKYQGEFKYRIYHMFMKHKYQYFDKFVGVSDGVIGPFKALNGTANKELFVIPNYIDTNEIYEKSKIKTDIKVAKDTYNLVSVGRLTFQKGYDILINEYKKIIDAAEDKKYHLYIIGDGEERSSLEHLVKQKKLNDKVTFLGSLSNPYNVMKLMDGFVLTSRYEGQGMVILEAKALDLDIFITEHLTQYVDGIKGCTDIKEAILKAKKRDHSFNYLKDYNHKIMVSIDRLFSDEEC